MGLFDFLRRLMGTGGAETRPIDRADGMRAAPASATPQRGLAELARRLDLSPEELQGIPTGYTEFQLPKRSGGHRRIAAPVPPLKTAQKRILRRLLARLQVHPCCMGFEKGKSIVHNALPHANRPVVLRMDIRDFFPTTTDQRVREYFDAIGWDRPAADLLTRLCTHKGALPQGGPTSPRLSNLVNYRLDARLAATAARHKAAYTRYADDLTFSFAEDVPGQVGSLISSVKAILRDYGYRVHQDKKLRVARRHQRQVVTGLVVNDGVALPRATRRTLRAVAHRLENGRPATLTPAQYAGWRALWNMVYQQATGAGPAPSQDS